MERSDPGVHRALAAPARRALLAALTEAAEPLDSRRLAELTGQHVTTVRHHLTELVRAGLVEARRDESVAGRGRPRLLYGAAPARAQLAAYQDLVEVLALGYGADPAARSARAEQAGRSWAGDRPPTGTEAEARTPVPLAEQVVAEAERWGFEPELRAGGTEVALHGCPFLRNAERHPEVVCAVHQGLLDALAERAGAPGTVRLRPFAEPGVCLVALALPNA
ncbi:helix-turn-helix domain-containing protein [Kitasatospora sp. NPDC094015]|uniref:helix-turn-helix domain-containing protein n=1 Tax=Kitasatospora sp. NPDC094015 TaxID=3155205 RepID=UPI00332927DA